MLFSKNTFKNHVKNIYLYSENRFDIFHVHDHYLVNWIDIDTIIHHKYFLKRAEGGNISPQLLFLLQFHGNTLLIHYTILLIDKTIKYWLLDTTPAVAGLTQNKLYSCADPRNPVICSDHWFWRSLGSRAANEGSRSFHNDGECPPLPWDLLLVKDHDWQPALRIYANKSNHQSLMTYALVSQIHVHLLWINARFSIVCT